MKKRVAILFFGLTKQPEETFPSFRENVLDPLTEDGYEYDIYLHTYLFKEGEAYINSWSYENVPNYNNDGYKLFQADYVSTEYQSDVLRDEIDITTYYDPSRQEITDKCKTVLTNIVLANRSKKKVLEMFAVRKEAYDYAILIRPDLRIRSTFDPHYFKFLDDTNFLSDIYSKFLGYNDKYFIAKPNVLLALYEYVYRELPTYFKGIEELTELVPISEPFWKHCVILSGYKPVQCAIDIAVVRCAANGAEPNKNPQ
jgi:hypothetical protein